MGCLNNIIIDYYIGSVWLSYRVPRKTSPKRDIFSSYSSPFARYFIKFSQFLDSQRWFGNFFLRTFEQRNGKWTIILPAFGCLVYHIKAQSLIYVLHRESLDDQLSLIERFPYAWASSSLKVTFPRGQVDFAHLSSEYSSEKPPQLRRESRLTSVFCIYMFTLEIHILYRMS